MNDLTKTLLMIFGAIAFTVILLWGRTLLVSVDEPSLAESVSSTLNDTAADGELVYKKQVDQGCHDNYGGFIKTGRSCSYRGDAIYILTLDQTRKLTSLHDELISKDYELSSEEKQFNPESMSDIPGKNDRITSKYGKNRGSNLKFVSLELVSGKRINRYSINPSMKGLYAETQERVGRDILDNEYVYEVTVHASIPD